MTEIFITDITTKVQAKDMLNLLKTKNPELKISCDLDETEKSYPCGHTVLRAEGVRVNPESILTVVRSLGHTCEILEDKVCV
jgi:hypothetical protein